METFKKTSKFLILIAATLFMAACGSKGGSSTGTTATTVLNCTNCSSITSPTLLATVNAASKYSSWPAEIVNMQVHGNSTYFTQNNIAVNYNVYSGSISVQGVLRIKAQLGDANWKNNSSTGCVINAGDYSMTTYTAGSMSNATNMQIPDIVAGPMRLKITNAMLYKDSGTSAVRMYGSLQIVSVNGTTCGPFYTTMY